MSAQLMTNLAVILVTLGAVHGVLSWIDRRRSDEGEAQAPDRTREGVARRLRDLSA